MVKSVTTNCDFNVLSSCEGAGKMARNGRGVRMPGKVWNRASVPKHVTLSSVDNVRVMTIKREMF